MTTFGFDVETTKFPNIHPWQPNSQLVMVQLADESGWAKEWVFNHKENDGSISQRQMIEEIRTHIKRATRLVGHNLKFDLNWLRELGINFDHCKLWCTQLTEYLLRGQKVFKGDLKLGALSKKYLSIDKIDKVKTYWDAGFETTEIPLKVLKPYGRQDVFNALAIYQRQVPLVRNQNLLPLVAVQNECTKSLSEIEYNGMLTNPEVAEKHLEELQEQVAVIDTELKMMVNEVEVNLGSKDHLSAFLFGGVVKTPGEEWKVKTYKFHSTYKPYKVMVETEISGLGFKPSAETKKEGVYTTDKGTIKYLKATNKKQRRAKTLLQERSVVAKAMQTLKGKTPDSGLINKTMPDNRVHGNYNQTVTITGRFSCSDPNLQNQPRGGTSPVKQIFIPRFDKIFGADGKQLEWRIAAYLSGDPVMLEEIEAGVDVHAENAIAIFGASPDDKDFKEVRTTAKIVTFRLLYGGSAYGFYMDSKMPNFSLKKWEDIVEKFYHKYKKLKQWQDRNFNLVWKSHGTLVNPTGRIFVFEKGPKGYSQAQVKNYPVQSMATADIIPLWMNIIYMRVKKAGLKSLLIGQVHDNILFDAVESEIDQLAKICTDAADHLPEYIKQVWGLDFNIPLSADIEIGDNYGQMEEYHAGLFSLLTDKPKTEAQ